MNSNVKLYCNLLDLIEKKRNEVIKSKMKHKAFSTKEEDNLLEKYDELLLEKYKKLEEMLERENK